MLRIFSFALSIFLMCFIITFVYDFIKTNLEMSKFFAFCDLINKSNSGFMTYLSISIEDWIATFVKTPRFLSEYESRYDCTVKNIPYYEELLESMSRLIGFQYTSFDPWRHCRIYDHEIKIFNLYYAKLIMPDLQDVSILSLAMTIGFVLFMLIVANDWLLQKGAFLFGRLGMVKVHVIRDNYNIYRAVSLILLGSQNRFREMSRRFHSESTFDEVERENTKRRNGRNLAEVDAAYHQFRGNCELSFWVTDQFKMHIDLFMDTYEPQFRIKNHIRESEVLIHINEEEDGYYTALVPSVFAQVEYGVLEFLCFPYRKLFKGGERV